MKKLLSIFWLIPLLISQNAFSQDLNLVWELDPSINAELPPSVQFFRTNTPIDGNELNAQYLIMDLADQNIKLKAVYGDGTNRTPLGFVNQEENKVYGAINAGFFGGTSSFSLVLENGQVLAPNIKALTRQFNGNSTTYFPTRGAFGISADRTPDVAWIYNVGSDNTTYSYPTPSPNALGTAPQPTPTATFPAGGSIWDVATAVGGSPVLLEAGEIMITDTEELISVENDSRAPRTAVGYTADGKVIMLVVDGRQPGLSLGVSLTELAQMLKELGVVEALNLDGGSSSAMVANNQIASNPSGSNGMIATPSALLLMQNERIFDTENTDRYAEVGGPWAESATAGFYGTSKARFAPVGDGSRYAVYNLQPLSPAKYEVGAWWVPSSNRSKETPYIIARDGFENDTIRVDQSTTTFANRFNSLGTFDLGPNDSVLISNLAGQGDLVTADAIRLRKVGESEPIITLSDGNSGDHLRGSTLAFDILLQSPNSGITLENLKVSVVGDNDIRTEISNENLGSVTQLNKTDFSYLLNRADSQLTFEFELTDSRGRIYTETYVASLKSFEVSLTPDVREIEVNTRDTLDLVVSANLPASTTTTLATLKVFKSVNGGAESQVGNTIALSGTTASVNYEYVITDRANQSVSLRFEVETADNEISDRILILNPTAKKGNVRIAVISDLNGSFGSVTYEERITQLIARMPEIDPDFVICGGDMIAGQSASLTPQQVDAMWAGFDANIAEPLRNANIPFAFTMGNHDANLPVDIEATERYWNVPENFPGYFPIDTTNYPLYQSFLEKEDGDIFMVAWNASDANISEDELTWLRNQLESDVARNASYRFIIGHLPLYAVASERNGAGNVLNNANELRLLMEELDVHTYFSGHHHAYYPAKRGNVDLLNAGAVGPGARVLIGSDLPATNTFTLVDLFLEEDTLIYNTFKMPVSLPEKLDLLEEQTLPEIIEGFNGFVIRRDVNTSENGTGNFSKFHLQNPTETEATGTAMATRLADGSVRISGTFSDLSSNIIADDTGIGLYESAHNNTGNLAFNISVTSADRQNGTFEQIIELDERQIDLFAVGNFYLLIKTENFPNGEVRTSDLFGGKSSSFRSRNHYANGNRLDSDSGQHWRFPCGVDKIYRFGNQSCYLYLSAFFG